MASGWRRIVDDEGQFRGAEALQMLDTGGDVTETLEECFGMVHYLAWMLAERMDGSPFTPGYLIEDARRSYWQGLAVAKPGYTNIPPSQWDAPPPKED